MENNNHGDFPQHFRCPISMEVMKDPVTISTGVTYDRKNIEKWFHIYKKKTCPATMQSIESFEMTPNHTLKRLILAWRHHHNPAAAVKHDELAMILENIDSTPFKVRSLRKLRSIVETGGDEIKNNFKISGGVDVLVRIMVQILVENHDFTTIRACEEALGVLHHVPFSDEQKIVELLMNPNCTASMAVLLQRGSSEARFFAVETFRRIIKADQERKDVVCGHQGVDFIKSLLETVSDEICGKTSSCALKLLIEILNSSKKSRLKAIEAGAICTLIELLPDSIKKSSRCERIMQLIKLLCGCAEGRLAFIEHGLGIPALSKKMMSVSNEATIIGVNILWLISNFNPTERVLEEMLVCGAVKKLVAVLHIGGGGGSQMSTKEKVVKILKMHGGTWRRYSCFPSELKNYQGPWGLILAKA